VHLETFLKSSPPSWLFLLPTSKGLTAATIWRKMSLHPSTISSSLAEKSWGKVFCFPFRPIWSFMKNSVIREDCMTVKTNHVFAVTCQTPNPEWFLKLWQSKGKQHWNSWQKSTICLWRIWLISIWYFQILLSSAFFTFLTPYLLPCKLTAFAALTIDQQQPTLNLRDIEPKLRVLLNLLNLLNLLTLFWNSIPFPIFHQAQLVISAGTSIRVLRSWPMNRQRKVRDGTHFSASNQELVFCTTHSVIRTGEGLDFLILDDYQILSEFVPFARSFWDCQCHDSGGGRLQSSQCTTSTTFHRVCCTLFSHSLFFFSFSLFLFPVLLVRVQQSHPNPRLILKKGEKVKLDGPRLRKALRVIEELFDSPEIIGLFKVPPP